MLPLLRVGKWLKYSSFFHWSKFWLSLLLMVAICWEDISLLVIFILLCLFTILLWVWVLSLTIHYHCSYSYLLNIFSLYIRSLKMYKDLKLKRMPAIIDLPYNVLQLFPSHLIVLFWLWKCSTNLMATTVLLFYL